MPGYDVISTEGAKAGLFCPECNLILKAAVQTLQGDRLCESCYEAIARYVAHVVCLLHVGARERERECVCAFGLSVVNRLFAHLRQWWIVLSLSFWSSM